MNIVNFRLNSFVKTVLDALNNIVTDYKPAVFASSLAAEDMVLTDLILRNNFDINIFTLNTGRLHSETLNMLNKIYLTYKYKIKVYYPLNSEVNNYIFKNGINAFYDSVQMRKKCCYIRKVKPLKKALIGNKSWITGQRRTQSITRSNLVLKEKDIIHNGIIKFNPLYNWLEKDIWNYINTYNVPYNTLYDNGYLSIGCEPCTRPTEKGKDIRSGRWWWENSNIKECGLHILDGKLIRIKSQKGI
ncbi:phosphoadenylyl-sulfate reductase [Candidatus Profftella armatura]|uniref:phosphoadenylyl-sulfate reductase n=1 Tax=Candidatus Profftella armatura TaxID=669502 RepID=UPI003D97F98E